jgi:hypothetical protein
MAAQRQQRLLVKFAEHIALDRIAGMVSSIAAYGNVFPGGSDRDFAVEVFRPSNLSPLKKRLLEWERYGTLRWSVRD